MTYYVKTRDSQIFKGKAEKYVPGMIPFSANLFNPYTRKKVVGWNNYKAQMRASERSRK